MFVALCVSFGLMTMTIAIIVEWEDKISVQFVERSHLLTFHCICFKFICFSIVRPHKWNRAHVSVESIYLDTYERLIKPNKPTLMNLRNFTKKKTFFEFYISISCVCERPLYKYPFVCVNKMIIILIQVKTENQYKLMCVWVCCTRRIQFSHHHHFHCQHRT